MLYFIAHVISLSDIRRKSRDFPLEPYNLMVFRSPVLDLRQSMVDLPLKCDSGSK